MEPGPRDSADVRSAGLLDAAGRSIGFLFFAAPAMAILAALVLLPAYKKYAVQQYVLECKRVEVTEADQCIAANERLELAAKNDPLYISRLMMSQSTLMPANEVVVEDPENSSKPPLMIAPDPLPRPDPPNNALLQYAAKLEGPKTKRGLLLIAVGGVMAGLFLFSPPSTAKLRKRAKEEAQAAQEE